MIKPSAQICAAHQELIAAMLDAPSAAAEPAILQTYAEDGWRQLVAALRAWRVGQPVDLTLLDEEDQMIFAGVQYAHAHPDWLPALADEARHDAAQSIARMIFSATWGDHDALELLSSMREAAADLGHTGSTAHALVQIVEGARALPDILADNPAADAGLIEAVLDRLIELEAE
ncbi:hypothetical protein [Halothiobacillus sp. DCM-1]|uniref:hypothetical protein n=1 Tax=Halothiobacillus sp. DCM-1 TaxID=3112558 RepID=UPI003245722E